MIQEDMDIYENVKGFILLRRGCIFEILDQKTVCLLFFSRMETNSITNRKLEDALLETAVTLLH